MLSNKIALRLWGLLILLSGLGILGVAHAASGEPVLRYGVYALPSSLDPAWGTTISDSMLKVNVYEGLTTYDAAGNVIPGAARHWKISDDGLHYTFHLRKGLRWSNGAPLTAQQFANTVLRVLKGDDKNQPTFHYTLLKNANEILQHKQPLSALGMKVIDPHTLHFELSRPAPYFPELLVTAALPTPRTMDNGVTTKELEPAQWITNGAYQVSDYDPQKRQYRFVKNPFYHSHASLYFQTIQVKHYPKLNEGLFALLNKQLDSYDRGDQLQTMAEDNELVKVVPLAVAVTVYLTINTRDDTLKNLPVRQALSLALDRSAIVQALGYNDKRRAFSFSPDYPKLHWHKLPAIWGEETLKHRQQRALKLMNNAGYSLSQPLKLEFLVNKGHANELVAGLIRRQWADIGVNLTVISHPTALHYGKYLRKGHFQIARAGWGAVYPDPASFLEILHRQQKSNYGGWEHTAYSNQLDQLLQQPLTPKQRAAVFLSLETILQQEVPVIPVYNKVFAVLLAPWLKTMNQQQAGYLLWRHFRPEKSRMVSALPLPIQFSGNPVPTEKR